MPKFAANLHYMFSELEFLDRIGAAAAVGFRAVEFQVPYHYSKDRLRQLMSLHDVGMVLMDSPVEDWHQGSRGIAAIPGLEREFQDSLPLAIEYATALNCRAINLLAGALQPGTDRVEAEATFIRNLKFATAMFVDYDLIALIEPINGALGFSDGYVTEGMPGYFLNRTDHAISIIKKIDAKNLKIQFDCYHRQIVEGNIASAISAHIAHFGHVQFAGVPGRHEPDIGELNYTYLFDLLDTLGFDGWVGCEYRPAAGTLEGLRWASRYGIKQPIDSP